MKKEKELTPFDGRIGNGKGDSNWTKKEHEAFKKIVIKHKEESNTPEGKMRINIFTTKIAMEFYISEYPPKEIMTIGHFLKRFIKATGKKNKTFAKYIGLEESNLSSIISGKRKINIPLALKLEQIFGVNPSWWFEIQLKNEFLDLKKQKKKLNGKKYSLKGLLKKVS